MTILQLESFEIADADAPERATEADIADLRTFDRGYAAGWDDAVAAQDADITRLRSGLGQQLQDLDFTYQEARGHVLRALEPLFRDIVAKILPSMALEALAPVILEQLMSASRALADAPAQVAANPANRRRIEELVIARAPFPVAFLEDATLDPGQAHFMLGEAEYRVDLDGVVAAIGEAVAAFFAEKPDRGVRTA